MNAEHETTATPCPRCRHPVLRGEPTFPFCSRRCQEIDLSMWLGERIGVPLEDRAEEAEKPPDAAEDA